MYQAIANAIQVLFFLIWALSCKESESAGNYRNSRSLPSSVDQNSQKPTDTGANTGNAPVDQTTVSEPLPLADAAAAIIAKNCVKCHGAAGAQGGFGIIDNVPAMLASNRYLVAGNPEASLLFTKLSPTGNMPPAGPLKSEDVATMKSWIQGLQGSGQLVPLKDTQVLDSIGKDIQVAVGAADQVQVRYFSLHVPNNVGATAEDLDAMRKALFKVVNSLSRSPVLVKPVAVDAKKLIYRVRLDEMGIPVAVFEAVMNDFYPYSQQFVNNVSDPISVLASQNDSALRAATGSANYLIRADWFVSTATLPVPYERLLQLPATQAQLETQLGFNSITDVNADRVLRSGFRNSGMSQQNRIIERHSQVNGLAYWTSYDFGSTVNATSNIFNNPLGPVAGNINAKEFAHDGSGVMFQLANGMFAYRVVSAAGVTLDKAPTNTVNQAGAPAEFLSAIVNGVSCMSCHNAGLIYKKDEVRTFAQANLGDFAQAEIQKVLNIYPEEKTFKDTMDRDNAFYNNAMTQLGIDPKKPDPVNQTFRFYNRSLTKNDVKEELGVNVAILDGVLVNEPFKSRWSTLRSGGAISREDMSALVAQALEQSRIEVNVAIPRLGDFLITTSCMFASQIQMDNCVVAPQP